jgi:hypothetical protein
VKSSRECGFSNGGHYFAAVNSNNVQLYNTHTCEIIAVLRYGWLECWGVRPIGRRFQESLYESHRGFVICGWESVYPTTLHLNPLDMLLPLWFKGCKSVRVGSWWLRTHHFFCPPPRPQAFPSWIQPFHQSPCQIQLLQSHFIKWNICCMRQQRAGLSTLPCLALDATVDSFLALALLLQLDVPHVGSAGRTRPRCAACAGRPTTPHWCQQAPMGRCTTGAFRTSSGSGRASSRLALAQWWGGGETEGKWGDLAVIGRKGQPCG